jgi:cell wall-associated NlpC family hydrolase
MIAREKAENLKSSGVIDEYHIVTPDEYAIAKQQTRGNIYIREELIKTAQNYIAVPYLWGGSSSDAGFDCSGLAMTVYQLNGLDLPRSSKEQYEAGTPVERDSLLKGDLVFFATSGKDKVTHVGIYVGEGRFIHAPGRGKNIRVDFLSRSYYKKRYLGGRAYL